MKIKKLLSIFLVTIIIIGVCPVMNVSAEEKERTVVDSGFCGAQGDNLKWTLYDDGELVISGVGEMDWYYTSAPVLKYAPWWQVYYNKVRVITIEEGVTSIGAEVFLRSGTSFNKINLPMSLEFIEGNVFGCTNLPEGAHLAICYPGDAAAWGKVQMKTVEFIKNEETGEIERVFKGLSAPVITAFSPVYKNAKLYLNGEEPAPFCEILGDEELNVVSSSATVKLKSNYYFGDLKNATLKWVFIGESGEFNDNINTAGVNYSATLKGFKQGEGQIILFVMTADGKAVASDETPTFVPDYVPEEEYFPEEECSPVEKFFAPVMAFFSELFLGLGFGLNIFLALLAMPFQFLFN